MAIGVVAGHEITHGFDDQGAQMDGDGNLVNRWEPETKRKYLERAQCIVGKLTTTNINQYLDSKTYKPLETLSYQTIKKEEVPNFKQNTFFFVEQ